MKIAFYAPLKSPDHPVPSGDRLMARMLIAALEQAGHAVTLVSDLRSYAREPKAESYAEIEPEAQKEIARIAALWNRQEPPDLWFCYHPYYKAPDLLGPALCRQFDIPYVTAEASYSFRRNIDYWAQTQALVLDGLKQAAVNICFTKRDSDGLAEAAPKARTAMLRPFIRPDAFLAPRDDSGPSNRLITVAMMRAGDKMDSYELLAKALTRVSSDLRWTLSIIGDGPMRVQVQALFEGFPPDQIKWHGEAVTEGIAHHMSESAIYLWPGFGEAYGLAYLEAQAAGLPVVAMDIAGVPEAVNNGVTGLLTPVGDIDAYAHAIEALLRDKARSEAMGQAARQMIVTERSLDHASTVLDDILTQFTQANA